MVEERRRHRAVARRRPGLHKGKRRKGEERSYCGRSRCLQLLDFYDCTVRVPHRLHTAWDMPRARARGTFLPFWSCYTITK